METSTDSILIKLEELYPNPYQPPSRLKLTEERARRGGESILRSGLIQIPVCRLKDGRYEIGDGWQRREWFAWLVRNGHPEHDKMPIILRNFTDQEMADLIEETDENKEKLNVLERAWYYRKYLADFKSITQAEFARRRGVSQGEIANTIRLLDLPAKVQDMIISHEITESHGRSLLQLKNMNDMLIYADDAAQNNWSVITLDNVIKTYLESQKPRLAELPKQKCRVCGCTDDNACVTEGVPCHWVEEDLCSACAEKTPPESETEEDNLELQPEVEERLETIKAKKASLPTQKPEEKSTTTKPALHVPSKVEGKKPEPVRAAPPARAPAAKPAWNRKLVLEEIGDAVSVSIMAEGKFPVMKGFIGSLESIVTELPAFLAETNAKWEVK